MAYYEGQGPRWTHQHGRQQSWDPSHGPQRSSASPTTTHEDPNAFLAQYEEIERANDNLAKSTRMFGMPGRHHRMGGPSRHHSVGGEFDGMRSHSSHSSSSVQGYLAHQRFPPRGGETEHMAKRRAAAQRERELRNYHQEQQYNRTDLSGPKSDRSLSPSGMSEEDRRELIARQHRALYGNESNLYIGDGPPSRPISQDARVLAGATGPHTSSPMNYDAYGAATSTAPDGVPQGPSIGGGQPRSRSNSNSSPAQTQNTFAMYDSNQPAGNPTSSSSPGASPTRGGTKVPGSGGVAPIGTRPLQAKRNTPPMPSPLGHGYTGGNERSQSSASNPATSGQEKPSGLGWGGNSSSGPWGSNKPQASVWG